MLSTHPPDFFALSARPKLVTDFSAFNNASSSSDEDNFSPVVVNDHPFSFNRYAHCEPRTSTYTSPVSPVDMYEHSTHPASFPYSSTNNNNSNSNYSDHHHSLNTHAHVRGSSNRPPSYMPGPSSPGGYNSSTSNMLYQSPDETFDHRSSDSATPSRSFPDDMARADNKRSSDSPPQQPSALPYLDQRRMSEPAVLSPQNSYGTALGPVSGGPSADLNQQQQQQLAFSSPSAVGLAPIAVSRAIPVLPSLHRGVSMGSLRNDSRSFAQGGMPFSLPSPMGDMPRQYNAENEEAMFPRFQHLIRDDGFDGPISPLQSDFSGSGIPFLGGFDSYGPSPPNTGTSTSSAPLLSPTSPTFDHDDLLPPSTKDSSGKTYAFVALPGNSVRKRPRRRYDEIERLYHCSWPDCNKSYGTLNHLNAHVTMQKHGHKRNPSEFKEMRKQWRKQKKEHEVQNNLRRDQSLCDRVSSRYEHLPSPTSSSTLNGQSTYGAMPSAMNNNGSSSSSSSRFVQPSLHRVTSDRHLDAIPMHGGHQSRQRQDVFEGPASWHADSRSNLHDIMASSYSNFEDRGRHHGSSNVQVPPPPPRSMSPSSSSRLGPDSTLLTPLSVYPGSQSADYSRQAEFQGGGYFDDHMPAVVRPGSGRRGAGHGGGDEY